MGHVFIKCFLFFLKRAHARYKATIYMFCSSDRNFNTISCPLPHHAHTLVILSSRTVYKTECDFSIVT